jgi:anaerobic ribonucleoside-triphosphate reductase
MKPNKEMKELRKEIVELIRDKTSLSIRDRITLTDQLLNLFTKRMGEEREKFYKKGYRDGIKDYIDYEYIDWGNRAEAHKGTIKWLDYVVKNLRKFRNEE